MSELALFEGFGIELEYMLTDLNTLEIFPIADKILEAAAGQLVSDFEDGDVTWSNELVLHVLELKTTGPAKSLNQLENSFHRSLKKMRAIAKQFNVRLLPTAMHPFMRPNQMKLWPHDNTEIYRAYDRIFGCTGHGWCNLQSMHINLPFRDDGEFERLHSAIRVLLPILPALAASSPIVEGVVQKAKDSRLVFYQKNQERIPSIAGQVIPERVNSIQHYHELILQKIYRDITPFDSEEILRDDWLNSRGAIARFERQSIEIRVLDIQECPSADLAIADFVVAILKYLVAQGIKDRQIQRDQPTEALKNIFDECVVAAEGARFSSEIWSMYLNVWNAPQTVVTAGELLRHIFRIPEIRETMSQAHAETISWILQEGSLATRILNSLQSNKDSEGVRAVYDRLSFCLDENRLFKFR